MHIVEAAALDANGSDPDTQRRLEGGIKEGFDEGEPDVLAFKGAIDAYIGLKDDHFPEFPEFAYSLKLPWVLSEFTDEEHARARAEMTDEQRIAIDQYHALVDRVLSEG